MKRNGKKSRKIRRMILACTLSAIVLIVATYTWFIGMRTVSVNPFEIKIATTEGLFLSMDGNEWMYELDVNTAKQYDGNTNVWATNGLIPLSSVGDLDSSVSRMKLFELGSYTTTPGGYRLLASKVNNTGTAEGEGYIAFDLFIKNLSGAEYYVDMNTKNEEAIYLTTDSSVIESSTGEQNVAIKTGIENSLRIGFTQIGRVEATTNDVSKITEITCSGTNMAASGYEYKVGDATGICRNAQIWEPNEQKHVAEALSWYNKSCAKRTKAGSIYQLDTAKEDYAYDTTTSCTAVTETAVGSGLYNAMQTYAVANAIELFEDPNAETKVESGVDIYDGLNLYSGNTKSYADYIKLDSTNKAKAKLVNYDYFTDAEKNTAGSARPEFMTLAPNSITKVRVYIWLEGQDIDNYNFAQLGKQVTINFGFTKERYTETDVKYDGPALVTSDPNYITKVQQS